MKVTYQFDLDDEDNNDKFELEIFQAAKDMYSALRELDNLKRNLYKGWKYWDQDQEIKEDEEEKFSRINVDELLDDLCEILNDSLYHTVS